MESKGLGVPGEVEGWVGVGGQTMTVADMLPWMCVEAPLVAGKSGGCGICLVAVNPVAVAVAVAGISSFLVVFLVLFF
jgi:hypothetical protein